jgi:EAL domain-containing protein (putative c-di-GMP-specific phosphodiesterase class I)
VSAPPRLSSLRFLVVEDHPFQRWATVNVLEALGAQQVLAAEDGRAALVILRDVDKPVDIVVSDLDMPEMDGMEFIRHLGESAGAPALILASSLDRALVASVETMARVYGVRLLGAIEKPVTAKNAMPLIESYGAAPGAARGAPGSVRTFSVDEVLAGLRSSEFEPFFQPKVDMRSGRVMGAEALARWRHPEEGIVGAVSFIPLLERSGHIGEFTSVMVQAAGGFCREWRDRGLQVTLAINLSQESLGDVALADHMVRVVQGTGLLPRDMIFEVTESAMAANLGRALENLSRLRMRGFGLSLDDYGTGYASMQQLTRIAFTELKIDKAFVKNAPEQQPTRAMLESSLEMAGKLGIPAVAEGIESRAEWDLLRDLGCDLGQGYYVARPMEGIVFLDWLSKADVARAVS